jgi:non-heme chloroperoxidase
LSSEFKIWNLSLGLAASAYATIQCAIELRDADLRSDLKTIGIPTLIVHGTDDRICLFELAKGIHDGIKGLNLFLLRKPDMDFIMKRKKN